MQVIENKAEVKMAEVPHTPIATSAGAESPLLETDAGEKTPAEESSSERLRRIEYVSATETCMSCVWFIEDDRPMPKGVMQAPSGECHRRPPVFRDGYGVRGQWPVVNGWVDVCGEGEVLVDED
jgi:hypothetical protein